MEIAEYDPGPLRKQINLFLAVRSQFCYVGAQVAVANYFLNFCEEAGNTASVSCMSLPTPATPPYIQHSNNK
jgi:FHS family L-fucose permease-like MFS transporter